MARQTKYEKIYNYYKEQIEKNIIKIDEMLPVEDEIIEKFNASHMTVNRAMSLLANNGYIRRVPGTGSFACPDFRRRINFSYDDNFSLNAMIENSGMSPKTVLLSYNIKKASELPRVASTMRIDPQTYIHEIIRLKYGNGRLVCFTKAYLSQEVLPSLDITKLEGSLDDYMSYLGIKKTDGYTVIRACLPDELQKKYFNRPNIALLHQRILWNIHQKPFELTDNYYAGDMVSIKNLRKMEILNISK